MSWMRRLGNFFHRERLDRDLEEELSSHIEEAVERGRSADDARRSFGGSLHYREQSRDMMLLPWLDALASDVAFGWRQLHKHRTATATAILSLALAIGATTAAFRLVDAVLLRKLPVAEPDRLYSIAIASVDRDGRPDFRDDFDYPTFRRQVKTVGNLADLMVMGMSYQQDAAFGSDDQPERIYRQFVSGNVFGVLGLQPAAGRLLTPNDDSPPGAHPVAVLSYDFWKRRFGRDPGVVGKTFRQAGGRFEIVGVAPDGYTGTEPGLITDVFIPAAMNTPALNSPGWSWFRTWLRPKPGVAAEQVQQPLQAALTIENRERLKDLDKNTPKQAIDAYLNQAVILRSAASGVSEMQREYRRPLFILGVLVALVLLIACANVGNLMTAQAASRAREMALRVSIGAGQWRLIQMVLVESALLAVLASAAGALFSWWSAPFVVSMLAPAEQPVRLVLSADWRVLGFGCLLALAIALLFGLAPALRASSVKPVSALKGGADPHSRRGMMKALVAAQVAFCVLVLFVAGLFVSTFQRLSTRSLGFSHQGLFGMEIGARGKALPPQTWGQVADQVRQIPGVESVSFAGWAPLSGNHWTGSITVPGRAAEPQSPYLLDVSPGYFETMRIGWLDGRDFRPGDVQPKVKPDSQPSAGVGIVNEAFARTFFDGQDPVGKLVNLRVAKDTTAPLEIVGYVRDSCYSTVRETIRSTVYLPVEARSQATFLIRTAGNPRVVAPVLRREVTRARPDFRVRGLGAETAVVRRQMIRERLLAALSLFFAVVALALAGIGLYGVLNYSVIQQRREIGIRMALGARSAHVVRSVSTGMFAMVMFGAVVGVAGGLASARFIETLLYEVKATDSGMVAAPILTLLIAAALASLPPALRAVRIDPVETLRSE